MILWFTAGWLIGMAIGYNYHLLTKIHREIVKLYESKKDKPQPKPTPKSVVIDPNDVTQVARFEQDILMKKLNPADDDL